MFTSIAIDAQGNKWFGTFNGVSELLAETSTGVQTVNSENQLTIYPNPVQNVLNIDLHVKMGTLEVFDITGKSVQYKLINGNNMSIDVSGLRAGIYLLQINSNDGIVNRKFVKE